MLIRYALFGSALAFAGPPIYIHIPKLYSELHGVELSLLGFLLLALRSVDFIQDPLLGWAISRTEKYKRNMLALGFAGLLCAGMIALFYPQPLLSPAMWLCFSLVVVFTGFSGLQILYYSSGVAMTAQQTSHEKIASYREAGILFGICAACVAPIFFASQVGEKQGYFIYSLLFCLFLLTTMFMMQNHWKQNVQNNTISDSYSDLLNDRIFVSLLAIGFLNTLPVGITSTLFLFYVDDLLNAPEHAGYMLLLFFLSAAIAAPLWGKIAQQFGSKPTMIVGMFLAIITFIVAWKLQAGDYQIFYIVCITSGAALGADMTLMPAMLSTRLETLTKGAERAFGLWGFVNKSTLALAAGIILPALSLSGFSSNAQNTPDALNALSFYYAAVPCLLKFVAIIALLLTPLEEKK